MEGCYKTFDKVSIREAYKYPYVENGRSFYVEFEGLSYNPPLIEVIDSTDKPLQGDNVSFNVTEDRSYGTNLWFEPIPFEFLKTVETKPQLYVEVDGLPAVCHNLTCDFSYIQNVGEVTDFTYSDSTKTLVIQGTSLPSKAEDIDKIEFAMSTCTVNQAAIS